LSTGDLPGASSTRGEGTTSADLVGATVAGSLGGAAFVGALVVRGFLASPLLILGLLGMV